MPRARLFARPARKARFLAGFSSMSPALPGLFAWGVVTGVAMIKGGLTTAQAVGISLLTLSGTTQLTAVPMLAAGVSLPLIAVTAILTGLRFPVYSAALSPDLKHLRPTRRWIAGFLMTDPGTALYLHRRATERPFVNRIAFYAGLNFLSWPVWLLGELAGILLAGWLPSSPKLAYLGVLTILALAASMIRGLPAVGATLVAASVALIGLRWPFKLGLIGAVLAGVLGALAIERWQRGRQAAVGTQR